MGFPYGDGRYGMGRYSRRPDWWRDTRCVQDNWAAQTCDVSAWSPVSKDPPRWSLSQQQLRKARSWLPHRIR